MKQSSRNSVRKYVYLLSIMLGLPLTGLLILGIDGDHHFNTLPYYTEAGASEEWSEQAQRIAPFELINQEGQTFNSKALDGKVWIAAFFPTNAPHVAQFTKQLLWPNFRYRDESDIMTVCFTLDAEYDQPAVLKKYVERNIRYNGFPDKWQFLTGEQETIDELIRESFMIRRDENEPNNIATLWLVDEKGYLRGVYHAASEDAIKDAVEDIALLQKEMDEAAYEQKKALEKLSEEPALPVLGPPEHTVPSFALIGADGNEFSHRNVGDRLRIVDFFFTRCPTICPIMSSQMARLQSQLIGRGMQNDVLLLSHSVDPEHDTPATLSAYGAKLGRNPAIWEMLTGDKEAIYDLARNGYFLTAIESDTAAGGIFHSDIFALVDEKDRIRGYYDGTNTEEVDQLLADAYRLWITPDITP